MLKVLTVLLAYSVLLHETGWSFKSADPGDVKEIARNNNSFEPVLIYLQKGLRSRAGTLDIV